MYTGVGIEPRPEEKNYKYTGVGIEPRPDTAVRFHLAVMLIHSAVTLLLHFVTHGRSLHNQRMDIIYLIQLIT